MPRCLRPRAMPRGHYYALFAHDAMPPLPAASRHDIIFAALATGCFDARLIFRHAIAAMPYA